MEENFEEIKELTKQYVEYGEMDRGYIQHCFEKIDNCQNIETILHTIRKGHTLDYLNFLYETKAISEQRVADLLLNRWVMLEKFHNMGMSKTRILKLIKIADKSRGYGKVEQIPKIITVYRGVNINNHRGLSWTTNKGTAEWFAKRFLKSGECGYIFSGQIAREDVIVQFSSRNETEIVCDWKKVKDIKVEEVIAE